MPFRSCTCPSSCKRWYSRNSDFEIQAAVEVLTIELQHINSIVRTFDSKNIGWWKSSDACGKENLQKSVNFNIILSNKYNRIQTYHCLFQNEPKPRHTPHCVCENHDKILKRVYMIRRIPQIADFIKLADFSPNL